MRGGAGAFGRRGLFRTVFALLFGGPGLAALVAGRRDRGAWQDGGRLDEVPEGGAKALDLAVRAGWERRKERAFLVRRGGDVVALSARCTHLGCTVRFRDGKLLCPCHGGAFGLDGAPLAGPVTEPLARLETRVADGRVQVRG
jgi:Rieske Fe-S protein